MAELSFASQDIRQAAARTTGSGIFFDLVAGFFEPANPRGEDTIIPGLAGRTERVYVADNRNPIVLQGYVTGTSTSDWNSKTTTLMGVMLPYGAVANLVIASSYLGTSGTWTIGARVLNLIPGIPVKGPTFQTWSIELESMASVWTHT